MNHTHRFVIAISFFFATATVLAESVRGAFGFELSTNISNYEVVSSCGTSVALNGMTDEEADHFRIFQMMEPRLYYLCVEFETMPIIDVLHNNGILSIYEGWIASIKAKSKYFNTWGECEDKHEVLAETFRDKHGQPLKFEEPYWRSKNPKMPHYKHHLLSPIPMIWESDNSVFLYPCNKIKDGGYGFSLTYESALWQKAVSNWRDLMNEQRILEKERSRPEL